MNAPIILDGRVLTKEIEEELKVRVKKLVERNNITPILAAIIVGEDESCEFYVNMKIKACDRIGAGYIKINMPESTSTSELLDKIEELNNDSRVHGILLQHPIPSHIDEQRCFDAISVYKDVDGVNTSTFGRMSMGQESFKGAGTKAVMSLLKHYNIPIEGKEAVVVGRSALLGKPVAMALLNENATVTICHSKTEELQDLVKRADIVVAAIEKPKFIKADWIKEGAVLIDTGYNPGNVGDIDLENSVHKCSAYTPVPGGIGPMTITSLITQTIESAEAFAAATEVMKAVAATKLE